MGASGFEDFDRQDVRIAVVMNGGVSLAVWISGVALELHHLVQASRPDAQEAWPEYAAVLELLHATARVDVIAGTSAGGLNGGFLALGLTRDCDLSGMRDLWKNHGDLEALLRDPLQRSPSSLLQGDDYFLPRVREAYRQIWQTGGNPRDADDAPVELVLTGTLWNGRRSSFTDDMGTRITEVDYDATFRFSNDVDSSGDSAGDGTGDLRRETVIEQLAVASRCTSSFPGAFEPHWVTSTGPRSPRLNDRWRSSGGLASFASTQYVLDGGVLLNKPIRPALAAIYRQAASDQVRRILAYVVPDPGELLDEADLPKAGTQPPFPTAQQVLLGVLTRLRSTDSVSRELSEIRERNKSVRLRRRARDRLATAMTPVAEQLAEGSWQAYHEIRVDHAARTVGALIAAGQVGDTGLWSEQELVDALRRSRLPFVPDGSLTQAIARSGAAWNWGQTTVTRLGEMTVDVLKRAIWLAPLGSEARKKIHDCREGVHGTLADIRRDRRELNAYWAKAAQLDKPRMPAREGTISQPASSDNLTALDHWIAGVVEGWEGPMPGTRRERLYRQSLTLAAQLLASADALAEVAAVPNPMLDPDHVESARLQALVAYLLEGAASDEVVLHRMLLLDVVQLAFAGATEDVEQEVELVQVSSLTPQLLTGVQQHHFGAFYRPSWRVNDWLRGRLDAAEQLMRILLSPERLRQLGHDADTALDSIREIALGPQDSPDRPALEARWKVAAERCKVELRDALESKAATALPICAKQLALPVQTRILREELPELARAINDEPDPVVVSRRWAESLDNALANGSTLSVEAAWKLHRDADKIGTQRITQDVGTDTFARTVSHAAAVFANTVGAVNKPKLVATVLSALRGYALIVWAMIQFATLRSRFAANAVSLAVAAGAVLLAVTMVVPGIPVGLTMLGVLLILAGATASALRVKRARNVGLRLIAASVLALGALGALLWYDWSHNRSASVVWGVLIKLGVALGVVLLGWWVAQARGSAERTARRPRRPESAEALASMSPTSEQP